MSRPIRNLIGRWRRIRPRDRQADRGDRPDTEAYSVRQFLDLSTAHLPQTMLLELEGVSGVVADPTEFGAWLWVPRVPEAGLEIEFPPPEVLAVQRLARSLGCDYVLLDSDAPTVAELPTYVWT